MTFRLFALVMAVLIFGMPCVVLAQQTNDVAQAIADAKRDVQEPYGWLAGTFCASAALGCLIGGVIAITAQVIPPTPPVNRLIGKTPAYVDAYTDTYKKEVRIKRLIHTSAGCLGGTAVSVWIVLNFYPELFYTQ